MMYYLNLKIQWVDLNKLIIISGYAIFSEEFANNNYLLDSKQNNINNEMKIKF